MSFSKDRHEKFYKCSKCFSESKHQKLNNDELVYEEVLHNEMKRHSEVEIMEQIINTYYKDNAKKLRIMVDKILNKLNFYNVEVEDFYSLANEIFWDVIRRYDGQRSFNAFLYSCLMNKFKTEMTRQNRIKRQADKNSISLNSPIGDDENSTIEDTVAGKDTIESQFFSENRETYSKEMTEYLSRLSILQKDVLHLISIGFTPNEIIRELHINKKQYDDCYSAIHSYRNIKILLL